jgi:lysozyme family protein
MNFEHVIDGILAREQGYTDHPADRGGPTNYGITLAVARANGFDGDMRDLPLSLAREIYRKRYIVRPAFDKVWLASPLIGDELIDSGVNMGPARAAEMLQRALNAFNQQGSRYADLFVDGQIGEVTLDALRMYLRQRGEEGIRVMVCALNVLQGARYFDIAEGNPSQEAFMYGWIRSRVLTPA